MKPIKSLFYKFLAVCILVCTMIIACKKQEVSTTVRLQSGAFKASKSLDSLLLVNGKNLRKKTNSVESCVYSLTFYWTVVYIPSPIIQFYGYDYVEETLQTLFQANLVRDLLAAGATAASPQYGTYTVDYIGPDLSDQAYNIVKQALKESLDQIMIGQTPISYCSAQNSSTCYINLNNNPGVGGLGNETPPKDPCVAAKDLTEAWNHVMATQEINDRLNELRNTVSSSNEHGFIITLDATGYHASAIVAGNASSTTFNVPSDNTAFFVVHTHPPGGSIAPSSTDITGLQGFGTGLAGDVIITGNEMTLVSVTDPTKYVTFLQKSNANGYVDKTDITGWSKESRPWKEFQRFSDDFMKLNAGVDATLPTQLYLMDYFKMGVTLQKWNDSDNQFHPLSVDAQYNTSTGSGTTMGGGGNVINSSYSSIQVSSKNCN